MNSEIWNLEEGEESGISAADLLPNVRGLSQIIFPTVSVIMTLRGGGGGGSEGVTLIFYLKHTLTVVIILQPSDVNFRNFPFIFNCMRKN